MPSVPVPFRFDAVTIYDSMKLNLGGVTKEYTEEGLHRPGTFDPANFSGTQLFIFGVTVPRSGEEFSILRIPFENLSSDTYNPSAQIIEKLDKMKFIELKIIAGVSTTYHYFGWIDSFEIVTAQGPKGNVLIRWHPDYYLTYMAHTFGSVSVTLGGGRVLRTSDGDAKRPTSTNPRRWLYDSTGDIILNPIYTPDQTPYRDVWCIVLHTETVTVGSDTYTSLKVAYFSIYAPDNAFGGVNYKVMNLSEIYSGYMEELMGLAPSSIIGVWFSPIRPFSSGNIVRSTQTNIPRYWLEQDAGDTAHAYTETITLVNPITTDDFTKYAIVDPQATVMSTIPWGEDVGTIKMYVDVGTSGCSLMVDLMDSSGNVTYGEGRHVQIPLIAAPVTSNDMSDYVLSGQREYDRNTARIQQEQALLSGIAGAGQGAISGGIAGGLTKAGGGVGAIAGFGVSIIGSLANYGITGYYNDKSQEATDKLMSNQIANVIISCGGISWYTENSGLWRIVKLDRDTVSSAELALDYQELGYPTNYYEPSCDVLFNQAGAMQFENVEVKGVGPEASAYIRTLFARGVNID